MKKIYYEKVGRQYYPVAEYDADWQNAFNSGNHLVMCYPGGQSRRYDIDPAYAPMIAAGRIAEEAVSKKLMEATSMRPEKTPLTPDQIAAWDALAKSFGSETCRLQWPSALEASRAAVAAMQEEAAKLLEHEAVQKAYEQFILVCELTKNHQKE